MPPTDSDRSTSVEFRNVVKTYRRGQREVQALAGVNLAIARNEFVAIVGPSGSGKSTLLYLAGLLDTPTAGEIRLAGEAASQFSPAERTRWRRHKIGFIFQFFNLVPTFTVERNVALPLLLDGQRMSAVRDRAQHWIERVGLAARATHLPEELSGGELQRAAIARALIIEPAFLLADEPTGSLDSRTGQEIMDLLVAAASQPGRTVVVVTHDPQVAALAQRTICLRDGRIDDAVTPPV